jgi:hypothetical protein
LKKGARGDSRIEKKEHINIDGNIAAATVGCPALVGGAAYDRQPLNQVFELSHSITRRPDIS